MKQFTSLLLLALTGCAGYEEAVRAAQTANDIVVDIAEPCVLDAEALALKQCEAITDPGQAETCVRDITRKFEAAKEAFEEYKHFRCTLDPTAEGCR